MIIGLYVTRYMKRQPIEVSLCLLIARFIFKKISFSEKFAPSQSCLYYSVQIMTIPRLGYKHVNLREGSIFWNYKHGEDKMVEDEVKFWIQTAKKEYFFTDDRVIKYQSENA